MNRAATMREWRRALEEALLRDQPEATDASVLSDPTGPSDRSAVVDRLTLHHASARCPAGVMAPDPSRFDGAGRFVEATFTATREVALISLRSAAPDAPAAKIVDATLQTPELLRPGVADWVRRADRAALSTLRSESVSWVVDARALGARQGEPEWQSPASLAHRPTNSGVAVSATIDALRRTGSGAHLLVMRGRPRATDRRVSGQVALLWTLMRGEIPNSVVLGMRDSLERVRFEIDEQLLEGSVRHAVRQIRWAQQPSRAPVEPGPQCRYCRLQEQCSEGTAHLEATRRYPLPPSDDDIGGGRVDGGGSAAT